MILLYLDPGSGSFLIQLLIAGIAGAGIAIAASWSKIKRWFNRNKAKTDEELEDEDDESGLLTVSSEKSSNASSPILKSSSSAHLPTKCPSCGAVIRPHEVKWLDNVTAECRYCGTPIKATPK
jgi:ribosomal protein L32